MVIFARVLEHYVDLIEEFGSTDGFNTEWSERLHIDYAKDAYRASNRKDYLAQMTKWLTRQESIDRFTIYLDWCRHGLYRPAPDEHAATTACTAGLEPGGIELLRVNSGSDAASSSALMHSPFPAQARELRANSVYKVSSTHLPALRAVAASAITRDLGASQFLPALQSFLASHGALVTPQPWDKFDLYKQIAFRLPLIPWAGSNKLRNIVRACPPFPQQGRQTAQPAHTDFALIRTGERNDYSDGTALEGLRVGLVRAIFTLPNLYQVHHIHPLAYVEWLTPLRTPDPASGLHVLSRSTRMHHVYAEIIEADRIVRNCHMMPQWGRVKDSHWTADNVTDLCHSFYLNPYVDYHLYSLVKLKKHGCI